MIRPRSVRSHRQLFTIGIKYGEAPSPQPRVFPSVRPEKKSPSDGQYPKGLNPRTTLN